MDKLTEQLKFRVSETSRQRNPGPWRRCHKEAGVSRLSERWSTRLPESMTLPKGEKQHFIIQCNSHPLSLSNMPYVPVTGRPAGLSSVTGLFTHCSKSDTISCRKKITTTARWRAVRQRAPTSAGPRLRICLSGGGRGQRPGVILRDTVQTTNQAHLIYTSLLS